MIPLSAIHKNLGLVEITEACLYMQKEAGQDNVFVQHEQDIKEVTGPLVSLDTVSVVNELASLYQQLSVTTAEIERLKSQRDCWPHNPLDLNGIKVQWRDDGRHYLYSPTGEFLWSGNPVWNAFEALRLTKDRDELKAKLAETEKWLENAHHQHHCDYYVPPNKCNCGLNNIRKKFIATP